MQQKKCCFCALVCHYVQLSIKLHDKSYHQNLILNPFVLQSIFFWFIYKLNDLKALKSWFSFFFSISSKCILVFPRRWWRKTIHVQWNPFNIYRQNREVKSYKRKIFLQLNLFVFCCFLTFPFPPFHIYSYQITLVLALP